MKHEIFNRRPVLITGGAGFIGSNLANALLESGERVMILDNLSRAGVERNWNWLSSRHGSAVELIQADIRRAKDVAAAVKEAGAIYHFAAQVAVTTSLEDPEFDFSVNVLGTLNVLHAWRELAAPPPLIFTSTNKVYGSLSNVDLRENEGRYEPVNDEIRARGISETQPLEFYSPYGCSKGAADQYVLDHARTFGLPALVFRMSCIYGPRQFGTEDQGWVAHFLIRAQERGLLTLYGDGRQVRDILFVEDLVRALRLARENLPRLAGQAFNIGGGAGNTISLLELLNHIEAVDQRPRVEFADWRPGDQRYYVSDVSRFTRATGWRPSVGVRDGIRRLHEWLKQSTHSAGVACARA
jgi:CDP-paratose 2-epimerase